MEEQEFYGKNNIRYLSVPIIVLIVFIGTFCIPYNSEIITGRIIFSSIFIVTTIPFIIFRKFFFFKIRVNSTGISKIYRKQIITEIKWESLLEIRAFASMRGSILVFLDYDVEDVKMIPRKFKTNVYFEASNKNLEIISQYKNYFKDKIKDVSVLGQDSKILF